MHAVVHVRATGFRSSMMVCSVCDRSSVDRAGASRSPTELRRTAVSLMVSAGPGGGLRHNIQRSYEVLRKRFRAPRAYLLSSTKAILSLYGE